MITETGYRRLTYEEILSDLTLKAKELFGEDIDVSEQTPLGKIINIMAYVRAKDHEEAEKIFYSRYPNTATGIGLDRLTPFVALTRNAATPAQYKVTVTGDEGTTIPFGFLITTDSGIEFYNTKEETIAEGETTCVITVECTQAGIIGNVALDAITGIVNPVVGIDTVEGVSAVKLGTDEESDYDLRQRVIAAGMGAGSCNAASIRAAIMKVPTVSSAIVLVNDTNETDERGLLPHSIAAYVAGGDEYQQEIAEAIFKANAVGIKTNGSITKSVVDDGGYSHTVNFNTVTNIAVTVAVSISTTVDYEGTSGEDAIKKNIMDYINGLTIGDDVILSRLYVPVYSVNGVEKVNSLTVSTDGSTFTTNDIAITNLQCATCNAVNITEV